MPDVARGRVVLRIDATGLGTVEVDGHELGHLTAGVHVQTCPGERTRVVLEILPEELLVEADAETRQLVVNLATDGQPPPAFPVSTLRGRRAMTLRGPIGG